MAYEHKDGSGTLFKADQKGNERAPSFRGELMLGGTLYELAAWIKEGRSGKFFSLSAKPKKARPAEKDSGNIASMNSDIPF